MIKAPLGLEVRPCGAPGCDIATNKRYREDGQKAIVACCFQHAEKVRRVKAALALAVSAHARFP